MRASTLERVARAASRGDAGSREVRRLARSRSPVAVRALAEAVVMSTDDEVRAIALRAIAGLRDQSSVDVVCEVWSRWAGADLDRLVAERGWIASGGPMVRARTALHVGRPEALADDGAAVAEALAEIAGDDGRDRDLAERARAALAAFRNQEGRDAVCELAVVHGSTAALEAALAGGYVSADPVRRAALLLLAGEFDRCAELDFDGSLLRSARAIAHGTVRARLTAQVRTAGRPEWIHGFSGSRWGNGCPPPSGRLYSARSRRPAGGRRCGGWRWKARPSRRCGCYGSSAGGSGSRGRTSAPATRTWSPSRRSARTRCPPGSCSTAGSGTLRSPRSASGP